MKRPSHPYEIEQGKQAAVQAMFTSIARYYDVNNSLLSFGLHHYWKRAALAQARLKPEDRVADLGAGTFDLALRALSYVQPKGMIIAVDLNEKMLRIGRVKAERRGARDQIRVAMGNAEDIPLKENQLDAVLTGFCLRNVVHLSRTVAEIHRILKPGGRMVVLEFSRPSRPTVRRLYDLYSYTLLPCLGRWISGDRTGVYHYLPDSIRTFPDQNGLLQIIREAGFQSAHYQNLSGGIVAVHVGVK